MKATILELEKDLMFSTIIPKVPERQDKIGAWFNDQYYVCEIHSIVYEFNKDGSFYGIEIGVITR